MTDTELADLAEVLLIAGGLGLALASAYLVRKPAQRTFRIWAGAAAVGIPGFLVGLALSDPELGVRAAYRELTEATRQVPVVVASPGPTPQVTTPRPRSTEEETGPQLAPVAGEPTTADLDQSPGTQPTDSNPPPGGDPSPTGEPSPTTQPSPTVDPSPTVEPSPTVDPSPTLDPSPTAEPSPTADPPGPPGGDPGPPPRP